MAKILVVDDQLGVRQLLQETFCQDEHEVFLAANGEAALLLLEEQKPELILMDMKMPGLSGIDVLRRIRLAGNPVKVMMMTAYEDDGILDQLDGLKVQSYLSKPFDLSELRAKVKEAL